MLRAIRWGVFKWGYDITLDGLSGIRRESCEFVVGGVAYFIARDGRKHFTLSGPKGRVADATRETGRQWAITSAEGRTDLVKPSVWRSGWEVRRGGAAGAIGREGMFTRAYAANVPAGVSLPVQVFVLYVLLMIFARQQAAASSGGAVGAASG